MMLFRLVFAAAALVSCHGLQQSDQVARSGDVNDDIASFQHEIRQQMAELTQANADMKHQLDQLTAENHELKRAVGFTNQSRLRDDVKPPRSAAPEKYTQHSELGCVSDVLRLECPDEQVIFTTHAYYGKYTFPCDFCCPPNPGRDCTELVEENRPEDWVAIKYFCDNKTTCEYENRGSPIDECQEGYISDYLQIFYDCIPDRPNQPVGFTAHAATGAESYYSAGEILHYDGVITNLGNHYNLNTSSFICPYDGVYMFNINLQAYYTDKMDAYMMRNNETLSYVLAFSDSYDRYPTTSSLVITPCGRGDVVWVRAATEGTLYATAMTNLFSGYLLDTSIN